MRKFIIIASAVAALAGPTAAMAAAPNGDYMGTLKTFPAPFIQNDHRSMVGELSARSIQNGQFVSGSDASIAAGWGDQTTDPGSRAEIVQTALGH